MIRYAQKTTQIMFKVFELFSSIDLCWRLTSFSLHHIMFI